MPYQSRFKDHGRRIWDVESFFVFIWVHAKPVFYSYFRLVNGAFVALMLGVIYFALVETPFLPIRMIPLLCLLGWAVWLMWVLGDSLKFDGILKTLFLGGLLFGTLALLYPYVDLDFFFATNQWFDNYQDPVDLRPL